MLAQLIASAALAFGAWMGLYSMLKPRWGSKTVGLVPIEGHAEGISEFRATFGGMFLFGHLATLVALWKLDQMVSPVVCFPLAAAWIGSGLGRALSILRDDGAATRQNWIWVGFEVAMGVLIAVPLILMVIKIPFG